MKIEINELILSSGRLKKKKKKKNLLLLNLKNIERINSNIEDCSTKRDILILKILSYLQLKKWKTI